MQERLGLESFRPNSSLTLDEKEDVIRDCLKDSAKVLLNGHSPDQTQHIINSTFDAIVTLNEVGANPLVWFNDGNDEFSHNSDFIGRTPLEVILEDQSEVVRAAEKLNENVKSDYLHPVEEQEW